MLKCQILFSKKLLRIHLCIMAHATVDCLEYVIFNDGCDDEKGNIIFSPTTIRHILQHSMTPHCIDKRSIDWFTLDTGRANIQRHLIINQILIFSYSSYREMFWNLALFQQVASSSNKNNVVFLHRSFVRQHYRKQNRKNDISRRIS